MQHMRLCLVLVLCLCLGLVIGCGKSTPEPVQKEIVVIHTGRILGNVFPLSLVGKDIAPLQYYHFIAGYVQAVRNEAASRGATVFLIDSGDGLQGSFASKVTGCANMVEFYNALEYDAIILGNLDAAIRPEQIHGLRAQVFVPFVTSEGEPAFPGAKTHGVITKNGISLAIVANFHGELEYSQKPDQFPTYYAADTNRIVLPFRQHLQALKELKATNPDYILFNWFKFESPETAPKIVSEIVESGADLIAAHRIYSRSRIDAWTSPTYNWPIPVSVNTQRANNGYIIARIDVGRDKNGRLVVTRPPTRIPMDKNSLDAVGASPDMRVAALMEKFASALLTANQTLGILSAPMDEANILNVYLDSLCQRFPGRVALYSTQSVRAPWPSGPLTSAKIFESLPWITSTVEVQLTSEQLTQLSNNENFRTRGEPLDPDAPTIVTSAYFGILLQRKFNLPPQAITQLCDIPESDSFTQWIRENPQALGESFTPLTRYVQNPNNPLSDNETLR